MRIVRTRRVPRALAIALAVSVWVPAGVNTATAAGDRGGGAQIDVSARIGGRYSEPAGVWVNPCEAPLEFVSERLADDVSQRAWVRVVDGVTEFMWQTYCYDPEEDQRVAATISQFWIANPDPGELIPPLFDYLPDYLDPPEVTWPNMSPEHGWLFVKVPMDFRINNLESVTLTASVTNVLGTATASVTATPSRVEFQSGEAGGGGCSAEEARQPYVPGAPGACSYRYTNSSAVAGGAFGSTTTMVWDITSNPVDPSQPTTLETFTTQSLAVAEVQAVVTCTGSGC